MSLSLSPGLPCIYTLSLLGLLLSHRCWKAMLPSAFFCHTCVGKSYYPRPSCVTQALQKNIPLGLLLLHAGVGKSCLLRRFLGDSGELCLMSTLGVDFGDKFLQVGQKRVKLQIWYGRGSRMNVTFLDTAEPHYTI